MSFLPQGVYHLKETPSSNSSHALHLSSLTLCNVGAKCYQTQLGSHIPVIKYARHIAGTHPHWDGMGTMADWASVSSDKKFLSHYPTSPSSLDSCNHCTKSLRNPITGKSDWNWQIRDYELVSLLHTVPLCCLPESFYLLSGSVSLSSSQGFQYPLVFPQLLCALFSLFSSWSSKVQQRCTAVWRASARHLHGLM